MSQRFTCKVRKRSDRLIEVPSCLGLYLSGCLSDRGETSKPNKTACDLRPAQGDSMLKGEVRGEEEDALLHLSSLAEMTDGRRYGRKKKRAGEEEMVEILEVERLWRGAMLEESKEILANTELIPTLWTEGVDLKGGVRLGRICKHPF
ncbi:hypothetical protein Baya_8623 [Bagarius yarrelli]|uniref:Uncharacterized protein n=1 Tax=Bagarius yarrelli TaxID=175774 RepID=A0A556U4G9_BAGYA|nr:hypothetical protein Baya_8623 [Bagarius yarrelli]